MNARLAPELLVSNLEESLRFWRDLIQFSVKYERRDEGFVFLSREGISFMLLEQSQTAVREWKTGPLERPFGRGINFEITTTTIAPILSSLRNADWPLFMEPEEKSYLVGGEWYAVRQFLVQDPDGYLLRFAEPASSDAPNPSYLQTT